MLSVFVSPPTSFTYSIDVFRAVLNLQENWENSITSSHILQNQLLLQAFYVNMVHWSQLMDLDWCIIINWSPYFIQISTVFYLNILSVPAFHPGLHVTFSCYASWSSSWLWQFLRFLFIYLMFYNFECFETYRSGCSPGRVCVTSLPRWCRGPASLKEDHRGEAPSVWHPIRGRYCLWEVSSLSSCVRLCLSGFSTLKCCHFSTLYSLEGG